MKRLVTLASAAALMLSLASPAAAVDVKVSGTWELGIGWADNLNFTDAKQGGHTDSFVAKQRIRPQFEFISDETLKGVLQLQSEFYWGNTEEGGGLDADRSTLVVRRAYLDWAPMDKLSLRMGVQGMALPSASFGSPILDTNVAGVVANYQITDALGVTGFWARAFDTSNTNGPNGKNLLDEFDFFGMTLPVTGEGFTVTPWAVYGHAGKDSGYWDYRADEAGYASGRGFTGNTNLWFAGTAFELDLFDPFTLKLDAMYGAANGGGAIETSGYLVSALFEYNSGAFWGNPGLIGWYASGDGKNDYKDGKFGKFGRMPTISNADAGFAPGSFGFPGSEGCMADGLITSTGVGTWGLGLQLDGVTFVDKLSHTLRAVYIRGTNDHDIIMNSGATRDDNPFKLMGEAVYLTDKDWALEFDFVSSYEVHENLTVYLDTSYVKLDLNSSVWGSADARTTNAWKAQILFKYAF